MEYSNKGSNTSIINDAEELAYLEELLRNLTVNGSVDLNELLHRGEEDAFSFKVKLGFYLLTFIVALLGNLCVIIVILRTKSLRTKFNMYIVNLAIADLMIPLFCMWIQLVASLNMHWILGKFLCKIHTFVEVTIVCASVFTLTTVTLDRFLATIYPSATWITQKYQHISIAVIWILSLSIGIPWIIYQFYEEIDWIGGHEVVCQTHFPTLLARHTYYVSFFVFVFLVPLILMFTLTVITVLNDDKVRRSNVLENEAFREMRRKAVYLTITVVIVFCVCWTPQQSLLLWDVYRDKHKKTINIRNVHFICLYVAYSSSAVNPVIYYLYNKCFRHALGNLFKSGCRGENSNITVTPVEITVQQHAADDVELDNTNVTVHETDDVELDNTNVTVHEADDVELDNTNVTVHEADETSVHRQAISDDDGSSSSLSTATL